MRNEQNNPVTPQMLDAADRIISMGCDVQGLAANGAAIEHWDDEIPAPSQGLLTARDLIYAWVEQLVDALKIWSGA
ncbi:MAG: hypothetical protein R3264_02940 [Anaerolineae bacterium]|nr:hypothetical protein [Anaerolineae bacterium]